MCGCSQGGMHGCSRGACVVAPGGACMVAPGGHAWLLGGHAWLLPGGTTCVVALGGHAWLLRGHAWLLWGGHAWLLRGVHGIQQDTEIRSMSGWYASYWNAFLFHYDMTKKPNSQNFQILKFSDFEFWRFFVSKLKD